MICPCHSSLPYAECCKPYHVGKAVAENALKLMRSRYSAYALHLADYIIETTHPDNSSFSEDYQPWRNSILSFAANTRFEELKIIEFIDGENEAFVTFFATLKQGNQDASFQEKSQFFKMGDKWLYLYGNVDVE